MTDNPLLLAAQYFAAEHGWLIVPMHPVENIPLLPRDRDSDGQPIPNTGGVKKASKDPAKLAAWWGHWPSANVGVACGPASNLLVLDVDCKPGGVSGFESMSRMTADHGPLPVGPTTRTPNGGEHRLFTFPLGRTLPNRTTKLRRFDGAGNVLATYEALDIRAEGGIATLPPSVRPDGAYTWVRRPDHHILPPAPDWLLRLIDPPQAPRLKPKPLPVSSADKLYRYVSAALDGECQRVARCGRGGRNVQLFQSAANLGELVGANALPRDLAESQLEAAAHDCGLVQDHGLHGVRATIASGMAKGISNPRELAL